MTTPKLMLDIQPRQVIFKPPYNKEQVQKIKLKNPSDKDRMLFKILMASPKQNMIKMRSTKGEIDPGETFELKIGLRAYDYKQYDDHTCKMAIKTLVPPPGYAKSSMQPEEVFEIGQEPMSHPVPIMLMPPDFEEAPAPAEEAALPPPAQEPETKEEEKKD